MTLRMKVRLLRISPWSAAPCLMMSYLARCRASRKEVLASRTCIFLLYDALIPLCCLEMCPPSALGPTNTLPQYWHRSSLTCTSSFLVTCFVALVAALDFEIIFGLVLFSSYRLQGLAAYFALSWAAQIFCLMLDGRHFIWEIMLMGTTGLNRTWPDGDCRSCSFGPTSVLCYCPEFALLGAFGT